MSEYCQVCGMPDKCKPYCPNEIARKSSASPICSIAGGDAAQDALNRMKRAADRGTGCHLTAEMINGLRVTFIGSMFEEEDPRQ